MVVSVVWDFCSKDRMVFWDFRERMDSVGDTWWISWFIGWCCDWVHGSARASFQDQSSQQLLPSEKLSFSRPRQETSSSSRCCWFTNERSLIWRDSTGRGEFIGLSQDMVLRLSFRSKLFVIDFVNSKRRLVCFDCEQDWLANVPLPDFFAMHDLRTLRWVLVRSSELFVTFLSCKATVLLTVKKKCDLYSHLRGPFRPKKRNKHPDNFPVRCSCYLSEESSNKNHE